MSRYLAIIAAITLGSCALFEPRVIIVPADYEIKLDDQDGGWYRMSAGQLKEIYEQQALLLDKLEKCKANK